MHQNVKVSWMSSKDAVLWQNWFLWKNRYKKIVKFMCMYNCKFGYFLNIDFKCEPKVCDGCYDLIMKAVNWDDVSVVSVNGKN